MTVCVATYFPIPEVFAPCDALPFDLLLPAQAVRANEYVRLLCERIRQAARDGGAVLVDVAAAGDLLASDPVHYYDCNHLSAQGNEIVADLFFEAVMESGTSLAPVAAADE